MPSLGLTAIAQLAVRSSRRSFVNLRTVGTRFSWYQLGTVYAAKGDLPRAKLASAEQQVMSGQMRQALSSAEAAENDLPRGSPDWLRAQDIAFQARAAIERDRKKR